MAGDNTKTFGWVQLMLVVVWAIMELMGQAATWTMWLVPLAVLLQGVLNLQK